MPRPVIPNLFGMVTQKSKFTLYDNPFMFGPKCVCGGGGGYHNARPDVSEELINITQNGTAAPTNEP